MKIITTALLAMLLTITGTASAGAVAPSAVVLPSKGTLNSDGSVSITMKIRCNTTQQAFEWSVELRQGAIFGNDFAGPATGLVLCNGRWQTVHAHVVGANGPYVSGVVNAQALVQLGDTGGGGDTQLEDRVVIRLHS